MRLPYILRSQLMAGTIRVLEEVMVTAERSQPGIGRQLDRRRKDLGLSRQALARRSGVSLPTVARILNGGWEHATFTNLKAVAQAMGMNLELTSTVAAQEYAEQQARLKAEIIARMVQGTSALESQAVDCETYKQIVSQTVHELMAGSRRRLWSPI